MKIDEIEYNRKNMVLARLIKERESEKVRENEYKSPTSGVREVILLEILQVLEG